MKKVPVYNMQTWYDIALLYTGTIENSFAIAFANNRSITDDLVAGELVIIPDALVLAKKEMAYFDARTIIPATGFIKQTVVVADDGIGDMAIGINFIIR